MKKSSQHDPENGLPENLGEWFSLAQLRAWTDEQLDSLYWENPELSALVQSNPGFRPKALLRVLTLACAEGLTDAHQVATKCLGEKLYQEAGEGCIRGWEELAAFRERNLDLLEAMLAQLMKRAVKEKFDCGILPKPVQAYISGAAAFRVRSAGLSDRQLAAA